MATETPVRLEEIHQEARAALDRTKVDYCPWCQHNEAAHAEVLAEPYGYCHHLLGFTNIGADWERPNHYEPVNALIRYDAEGRPYDSGFKIVSGCEPIPEDAVLVNPIRTQIVEGVTFKTRLWASSRVYLQRAEKKATILPAAIPMTEEALLEQEVRQLERKLAKQQLQKRRDELRKQLEDQELAALEEQTRPEGEV